MGSGRVRGSACDNHYYYPDPEEEETVTVAAPHVPVPARGTAPLLLLAS